METSDLKKKFLFKNKEAFTKNKQLNMFIKTNNSPKFQKTSPKYSFKMNKDLILSKLNKSQKSPKNSNLNEISRNSSNLKMKHYDKNIETKLKTSSIRLDKIYSDFSYKTRFIEEDYFKKDPNFTFDTKIQKIRFGTNSVEYIKTDLKVPLNLKFTRSITKKDIVPSPQKKRISNTKLEKLKTNFYLKIGENSKDESDSSFENVKLERKFDFLAKTDQINEKLPQIVKRQKTYSNSENNLKFQNFKSILSKVTRNSVQIEKTENSTHFSSKIEKLDKLVKENLNNIDKLTANINKTLNSNIDTLILKLKQPKKKKIFEIRSFK